MRRFARPFLESLEQRTVLSTMIPVSNHMGLVFDGTHNQLDITTADGKVQRWDVASQTLLNPYTVETNSPSTNSLFPVKDSSTADLKAPAGCRCTRSI